MSKHITNFIIIITLLSIIIFTIFAIKIFKKSETIVKENVEAYLYKEVEELNILVKDQESRSDAQILNNLRVLNYLIYDNPFTSTSNYVQTNIIDINLSNSSVAKVDQWLFKNNPIDANTLKYFKIFSQTYIAILQRTNQGYVIVNSDFPAFANAKEKYYFPNTTNLSFYISNKNYYIDKINLFGKIYKVGALPIYINGKVKGALMIIIPKWFSQDFQTYFMSKVYFNDGYPLLISKDGTIILPDRLKDKNIKNTNFFYHIFINRKVNQVVKLIYHWTQANTENDKIFYYTYIPTYGYYVGLTISKADLQQLASKLRQNLIFVVGLSTIILFLILLFFLKLINKSLQNINGKLIALGLGEIPEEISIHEAFGLGLEESINRVIRKYNELAQITDAFVKEHYDIEIHPETPDDIIFNNLLKLQENLAKTKEQQKKLEEEERIRSWRNSGLERIISLLSLGEKDIKQWSFNILSNLIEYVGGIQGGFFLLNEQAGQNGDDDKYFELISCYAFNEEKIIRYKAPVNSGIFAKIYKDPKPLYIKNLPEDYLPINTVLGEVKPKSLLLIPLINQNNIIGAIEIDFDINEIEEYKIQFLEEIASHISSSITSWKVAQETNILATKYEKQTQTLLSKERSLEEKLHELQDLSEQYSALQHEYKIFILLIDKFAYRAEISPNGRIISVNQKIVNLYQKNHEYFIDLNIRDVIGIDISAQNYKEQWEKILKGNIIKITESIQIEKQTYWIDNYFAALFDKDRNVKKILYVGVDISELKLLEKQLRSQIKEISKETRLLRKEERKLKREKEQFEAEKAKYETLLNAINQTIGLIILNKQQIITEVNNWISMLLDYDGKELINQKFTSIITEEDGEKFKKIWQDVLNGQKVVEDFNFIRKDGQNHKLNVNFFIDDRGKNLKVYLLILQ